MMGELVEADALNSARYLYLRELSEPKDNALRLLVEEAVVNRMRAPTVPACAAELEAIFKDAWPTESVVGCRKFELIWERYAAFLVTEEMVGSCGSDEDELYTGKLLRVYTRSHFLDHLSRDTGGHAKPLQHFKLICVNHLIDVASYALPEIHVVESALPPRTRIQ
jgi:hypothetical protein